MSLVDWDTLEVITSEAFTLEQLDDAIEVAREMIDTYDEAVKEPPTDLLGVFEELTTIKEEVENIWN